MPAYTGYVFSFKKAVLEARQPNKSVLCTKRCDGVQLIDAMRNRTLSTMAILAIRSAACCLILAFLLFNRHLIVPQICGRYGLALILRLFTTVPKPFRMTLASSETCRPAHFAFKRAVGRTRDCSRSTCSLNSRHESLLWPSGQTKHHNCHATKEVKTCTVCCSLLPRIR